MFTVAAFYHFAPLKAPDALRRPLRDLCEAHGIVGTVLVAPEGFNGTVAGPQTGIEALIAYLRRLPGCASLDWKRSTADTMPFKRLKVRLKREIVTLGRPEANPNRQVGTYVAPQEWNALISAPDVVTIDTRNIYEVAIGSFSGAIDPGLTSFGGFPEWWDTHRAKYAGKRVAMFCTGGIRCEKSTALLRHQGLEDVYHLDGGILRYLEQVPKDQSLWHGECFVFDQRVSLGHGLCPGSYGMCHACRRPVSQADQLHPLYEPGVSCPHCHASTSDADRARFRERQRQLMSQAGAEPTG